VFGEYVYGFACPVDFRLPCVGCETVDIVVGLAHRPLSCAVNVISIEVF